MNGQAVQDVGAARLLPKKAAPAQIRTAAARLGSQIRHRDGATVAADLIAELPKP